jgi:hypothetical protein
MPERLEQEAFVLAFGDKRVGGKVQQYNLAAIISKGRRLVESVHDEV